MTTRHFHHCPTVRAGLPPVARPTRRAVRRTIATGVVLGALMLAGAGPALAAAPGGATPTPVVEAAPAVTAPTPDAGSTPGVATGADPKSATLTVTGTGRAAAPADLAILSVGVEVARPTAKEAMTAQRTAAEALLAALRKQSVADRDIRTDSLSLSPVYTQSTNGESRVTGYQAGQTFSVKVRDVEKAGQVIGAVTGATGSAGRVNSVAFDVADPTVLRSRAREAAHRDAYEKASQHAELSGHRLGRLISLTEGESLRPSPGGGMPADAPEVPLAPGEIEEQVTVTAVYELL
ncbi:SIMPL domain-containing protein [Streptomyces sp. NPDC015346]|uniref:SIMPL domain-containing protein n=1 Tax=Streptomyces sp. NPDC015346 TaxID=3364954 RepID=UPI0036F6D1CE